MNVPAADTCEIEWCLQEDRGAIKSLKLRTEKGECRLQIKRDRIRVRRIHIIDASDSVWVHHREGICRPAGICVLGDIVVDLDIIRLREAVAVAAAYHGAGAVAPEQFQGIPVGRHTAGFRVSRDRDTDRQVPDLLIGDLTCPVVRGISRTRDQQSTNEDT